MSGLVRRRGYLCREEAFDAMAFLGGHSQFGLPILSFLPILLDVVVIVVGDSSGVSRRESPLFVQVRKFKKGTQLRQGRWVGG